MLPDGLFPDEGTEYVQIPVAEVDTLIPEWEKYAIMPDKQSVDSIRRYGVLLPVLLIQNEDGTTYKMAAGRRRIKAAVLAKRKFIDARVFPHGWTNTSILTLVENENRKRNPLSEWQALEDLLASGMTEKQITEETGTSQVMIGKLLSLRKLIEPLQTAFKEGKIRSSVALKAAKHKPRIQKAIAKFLRDNGRIRAQDVGKVRRAVLDEAVQRLPLSVFNDQPKDWKENVQNTLSRLRDEIKDEAPAAILEMLEVTMREAQWTVTGKAVKT